MSLTLMMTASFPTPLRMLYQIPGGKEQRRSVSLRLGLFWGCGRPLESGELFCGGTWGSQADRGLCSTAGPSEGPRTSARGPRLR